jgi:hypothetical protein
MAKKFDFFLIIFFNNIFLIFNFKLYFKFDFFEFEILNLKFGLFFKNTCLSLSTDNSCKFLVNR